MLKEYSYGAVIYKIDNNGPLFLLIKSKRSGRWGFPKGHIEEGETGIETAKREIFEETGIKDIKFIDGFTEEDVYIIDGTQPETAGRIAEKHSVYFLAEALSEPVNYDKEEISELRWANFEDTQKLLYFLKQKKTAKQAYEKIIKEDEMVR
ncbi:MAG: NUDIX domain-containing protein [Endomicrobia bacterium]|nr:NUDIX domain-containing protein [Endomicrobiia bacterium]